MIQWKGNNLKEVIEFTGKDRNFDKWFKSFEEYEKYVYAHENIFKIFTADGNHYEVSVGAWIIKTPDGCNVVSNAIFMQKFSWSEKDEKTIDEAVGCLENYVEYVQGGFSKQYVLDLISRVESFKERYT